MRKCGIAYPPVTPRYSTMVGIGNTPTRFTGELIRPYDVTVKPKSEVNLIMDRLRGHHPTYPYRFEERKFRESEPWDPLVDWEKEGPRLLGLGYNRNYGRMDYYRYLPSDIRFPYTDPPLLPMLTHDYNAHLDYPRFCDNPTFHENNKPPSWDSDEDKDDHDDDAKEGDEEDQPSAPREPMPIAWLDDDSAVLKGQLSLSTPQFNIHENIDTIDHTHKSWDALNGYNPLKNTGVRQLMLYLQSMTSQLREVLSINAMYRNHFGMPIKQIYYGALHQESKIMRHYVQMSNPAIAAVIECQRLGVAKIQRMSFLREHQEFERMCRKDVGGCVSFIDVLKTRIPNYMIIEHLFQYLKDLFKQMTNAPYEMPNHLSCQIITKKRILNTEKLMLHMAYIGYDDIVYFKACYSRIYGCKCPFV